MALHASHAAAQQIGPWRGASSLSGGGSHSLGLKADGTIVAWGANGNGQRNVPAPNANFVAVAAGESHSLGLKSDGTVIAWGDDSSDQTAIPAPNTNFMAIAAGAMHSMGLLTDGTLVAWGNDDSGQIDIPAPNEGFVAIAAGQSHSLALQSNGTIVAWGENGNGQVDVPAPNAGFTAVAAGGNHSLGLKTNGTVVAWGDNSAGQATVPAPNSGFIAIAAGAGHSLGLKANGTIVAWGDNTYGQATAPTPNSGFVAIAAGGNHSLGLKADGTVIAWGDSSSGQTAVPYPNLRFGQLSGIVPPAGPVSGGTMVTILGTKLGDGTDVTNVTLCRVAATIVTQTPWAVVVVAGPAPASTNGSVVVSSSSSGSIIRTNGYTYAGLPTVATRGVTNLTSTSATGAGEVLSEGGDPVTERGLCWGAAANPTIADTVATSGSGTGIFAQVSIPNLNPGTTYHVRAWARNLAGISYGADLPFMTPHVLTASAEPNGRISPLGAIEVAQGANATFTIAPAPGYSLLALLVDGTPVALTNSYTFSNVTGGHTIRAKFRGIGSWFGANPVAAGAYHSLALKASGQVTAYGRNDSGQTNAPQPNTGFAAVAAGDSHSLGLLADGRIVAWGSNSSGQTNVPGPNTDFIGVAGGGLHSLGLKSDGSMVGWGRNLDGESNVPAPNSDFTAAAAGGSHSLGLKSDGRIIAWGNSSMGQTAVPAPNVNFVAIAAGGNHSLGLKADGSIAAWGDNTLGQTSVPTPNTNFVAIAAGLNHSLGLKADGRVIAWGSNSAGQTNVPSLNTNFVAIAAGGFHSLGLKADGTVVAWGSGSFGQTSVPLLNMDFGQPTGIIPSSGPVSGGTTVAILGANLGSGPDVTSVTLCGIPATIVSQTPWRVIVQSSAAAAPTNGSVSVISTGYGSTTRTNGFAYFALPTVQTLAVTNITATSAEGAGQVLSDGGDAAAVRGLCWGAAAGPTITDGLAFSGNGAGIFAGVPMPNLNSGAPYHVRAWVKNALGLVYGNDVSFSTPHSIVAFAWPHGAILPKGVVNIAAGGSATFTITPDSGCSIADVQVDGVSVGATNSYTFQTVSSNHAIRAKFRGIGPWLGANPAGGGNTFSLALRSDGRIAGWGDNGLSQTDVPAPNTNFVALSAGGFHSLGLKADGTVTGWGNNANGQTTVPEPNTNFVAIAAGYTHSLGLKADGAIVGWGDNANGQVTVPAPNTNFVAVAAGQAFSLGLKADGTIIAWGRSISGQTNVPAPNVDFVAIASGSSHSLAIKADGRIVGWGNNFSGQLNVPAPNADFVAVAAGGSHSLGLKSDGSLVAWGQGGDGQTSVPSPNANFVSISAGGYHSLCLKADGTVVAFGRNTSGQASVPSPASGFGQQSGIVPPLGPVSGGTAVTILGEGLGNGLDVTNVTLCGLTATNLGQSPRAVFVSTRPSPTQGLGDVVVRSAGYGLLYRSSAFAYVDYTRTTNGTPWAWLASYGLTNDTTDADHDGMPEWAEYVAGTAPTSSASVFEVKTCNITGTNYHTEVVNDPDTGLSTQRLLEVSGIVLRWPSASNRWYRIMGRATPSHSDTIEATGLPATYPQNVYTVNVNNVTQRIFRISAGLAP